MPYSDKAVESEYKRSWALANREKTRASSLAWNRANPDKIREIGRTWDRTNPGPRMEKNLRSRFGINFADYYLLLDAQDYHCGICQRHASEFEKALAVDHDHSIEHKDQRSIRGLLCDTCNRGLGRSENSGKLSPEQYLYLHTFQDGC